MDLYRIIASVILGSIVSIIIFFMLQVVYAQIIVDFILEQLGEDAYMNILLILIGGEMIAIITSIVISIITVKQIKKTAVLTAAALAFISNLFLWFVISFVTMFTLYPEIFVNVEWYEIPAITPTLIMYFGIYVLNSVTMIWLVTQITYFILFAFYILLLRKRKKRIKRIKEKGRYRW